MDEASFWQQARIVGLALFLRRPGERATHRGGFVRNDGEQDARGAVGTAAALLPGMYRSHVQAERPREGALRQSQAAPELRNIDAIRNRHRVARQLDFALRMRQRFRQPGNKAATKCATLALQARRQACGFHAFRYR